MTVYDFLNKINPENCDFNGYLEDFLFLMKPNDLGYQTFSMMVEQDPKYKICVNYHFELSSLSASNKIIHYKDVEKLGKGALICPFIVYSHQGHLAKAWIFASDYLSAKGLYFALSEKGADLERFCNDILVCDLKQTKLIKTTLPLVYQKKAGYIQRIIDNKLIENYDQLLSQAQCLAEKACNNVYTTLNVCESKPKVIAKTIELWYLLKKCVYVQYMVDKDILNERHDGDNAAQRQQARANVESIKIISYANLWRKNRH